jgi:hypothetical protein
MRSKSDFSGDKAAINSYLVPKLRILELIKHRDNFRYISSSFCLSLFMSPFFNTLFLLCPHIYLGFRTFSLYIYLSSLTIQFGSEYVIQFSFLSSCKESVFLYSVPISLHNLFVQLLTLQRSINTDF